MANEKTEDFLSAQRAGKYFASILSNLIFFFFINLYPLWIGKTHGAVTNDWVKALWAMDVSIITVILGNIILIAHYRKWLRALIELLISVTALVSASVFYAVFPLDFSHIAGQWLNTVVRVLLIIGMAGILIGSIRSLVSLFKETR